MAVQTVSAQVRLLEQSLGHALFKPAGRGLVLTEAGQTALKLAEQIFLIGEQLPAAVRDAATQHAVRLVVGISDGLPKLAVRDLLEPVMDEPHLRLMCHEDEFDDLLADLAVVIDAVRTVRPGRLVLLGHSLGGLVAGRFVAEGAQPAAQRAPWYREVDALVMSSPALDPGLSLFQQALLAVAGTLAPGLAVGNGLSPDWISRDAATVAAYVADPLVHDRIGARLARFIADEGATVIGRAAAWPLPTLLMWAGADRCVRPAGSARFATAASVPGSPVSTREWPGLAHEIFNEPERAEVIAALTGWLDRVG